MMNGTGLTLESVRAAIELIEAAKRTGLQHVKLADFEASFLMDAVAGPTFAQRVPAEAPNYASPMDDPDMWFHVKGQ